VLDGLDSPAHAVGENVSFQFFSFFCFHAVTAPLTSAHRTSALPFIPYAPSFERVLFIVGILAIIQLMIEPASVRVNG
jgi:hypothetical protein